MASTSKCAYCGGTVRSDEKNCPHCGAANSHYTVDTPRQIIHPKTIDELKEYCAERGMPLLRMRFFVGVDFKEPKAFGIFRERNEFVVYKNKADGTRVIRYRGPDEQYAVNELYQKLLSECHQRGIYPDGRPPEMTYTDSELHGTPNTTDTDDYDPKIDPKRFRGPGMSRMRELFLKIVGFGIVGILIALMLICSQQAHKNDGYYRFDSDSDTYWYLYGNNWYYSDSDSNEWLKGDPGVDDYTDYRWGTDFDSDWGITDFKDSDIYHSSGSDSGSSGGYDSGSSGYDGWNSGDTDWDSSW